MMATEIPRVSNEDEEINILKWVAMVLRYWRNVLTASIGTSLLVVLVLLLTPGRYSSEAVFMPDARNASQLAGLAAQFGIEGGLPTAESPDFYSELLVSRPSVEYLISQKYTASTRSSGDSVSLLDFMEISGTDSVRVDRGVAKLRELITVIPNRRTSTVRIQVTTRDAVVSRQIAAHMLDYVTSFNVRTRQTKARNERTFLQDRTSAAAKELREQEDAIDEFMRANRNFRSSQSLLLQFGRLEREVRTKESVYANLSQRLEQARLDEIRDTPVITVVEKPRTPARRNSKRIVGLGVTAGMGMFLMVVAGLLTLEWARRQRETGEAEAELLYQHLSRLLRIRPK